RRFRNNSLAAAFLWRPPWGSATLAATNAGGCTMIRSRKPGRPPALVAAGLLFGILAAGPAGAAEPIKIGFGMGLTGGLAASGKAALLGMKIWEEEVNAKGGLLGRPVKLVYYDDQSNPATVPGIFTKLLD